MKKAQGNFQIDTPSHELLRARRIELGLTQQQLANITSITLRHYQRLESGERLFSKTAFSVGVAIADVLELDVHDLVRTASVDEYLENKEDFEKLRHENKEDI